MSDSENLFWAAARGEIPPPPAAKLLGWKALEAEPGSGRIRVQFEATGDFTNPMGNIQGGFLAAMLDDTLGPALATTFEPQEFAPTLELKVDFLRPAKPGSFVGTGRSDARPRRSAAPWFDDASRPMANGDTDAAAVGCARRAWLRAREDALKRPGQSDRVHREERPPTP